MIRADFLSGLFQTVEVRENTMVSLKTLSKAIREQTGAPSESAKGLIKI